jgi:hypothetical protein
MQLSEQPGDDFGDHECALPNSIGGTELGGVSNQAAQPLEALPQQASSLS